MLFYVFNKAKITKIAGLCFGLVLLGGFIPTAQALPLPESYFTPQVFSTMQITINDSDDRNETITGTGEVNGNKFTISGKRTDVPRSNCWQGTNVGYRSCFVKPKVVKLSPGSLQTSPDPAFPNPSPVGLVVASHGINRSNPYSFTTTFTFENPLTKACHIFVDDVDLDLNAAFRFFDTNGNLLNPSTYLVNDISTTTTGLPTVTKSSTEIIFQGTGLKYRELTQEIIPNVNTIKRIEFNFSNATLQSGGVGVYFSCSKPPIRKVFKPATINQGGVSKLEFEIDVFGNPVAEGHFLDYLPSGLKVADSSNAITDCGGGSTVSVTRDASRDHITFINLNLNYKDYNSASTPDRCTVSVDVTNRPFQSNPDCSSSPPAFTNTAVDVATHTFNTDGLTAACLIVTPSDTDTDFGDAPDSYGTTIASPLGVGAAHIKTATGPYIGRAPDAEVNGLPGAAATGDDLDNFEDEGGVTFKSFADGAGKFRIDAHVSGTIPTANNPLLCGYLDGAGDGVVDGAFSRDIVYIAVVGGNKAEAGLGNEEVCIQAFSSPFAPPHEITVTPNTANPGFHGASAKCDRPGANGTFSCTFTFNPDFKTPVTTYARFRLTADPKFFISPSPIGLALDGEVEDYRLLVDPTAVTIGEVELQALSATAFLDGLGIEQMDDAALLEMLEVWDPEQAATLAGADRAEILSALNQYLDPDGDGQVAVFAWGTLEERGTIGFYVDRREAGDDVDWVRINNDMLPGLITAPMGGEYQLADPGARSGIAYQYQLIEQEARGTTRRYGPYDLLLP